MGRFYLQEATRLGYYKQTPPMPQPQRVVVDPKKAKPVEEEEEKAPSDGVDEKEEAEYQRLLGKFISDMEAEPARPDSSND